MRKGRYAYIAMRLEPYELADLRTGLSGTLDLWYTEADARDEAPRGADVLRIPLAVLRRGDLRESTSKDAPWLVYNCDIDDPIPPERIEVKRDGEMTYRPVLRANPVGDHVDVVSGPGRGQRGVVRGETGRVAQVQFESGRLGHVERSALRKRGR